MMGLTRLSGRVFGARATAMRRATGTRRDDADGGGVDAVLPGLRDLKERGNAAFRSGDVSGAAGHYSAAIRSVVKLQASVGPDLGCSEGLSLFTTLYTNRALCHWRLGALGDAEEDCDRALKLDPRNFKASRRRAQIRKALGNWAGAAEDFAFALALTSVSVPGSSAAQSRTLKESLEKEMAVARRKHLEESLVRQRADAAEWRRREVEVKNEVEAKSEVEVACEVDVKSEHRMELMQAQAVAATAAASPPPAQPRRIQIEFSDDEGDEEDQSDFADDQTGESTAPSPGGSTLTTAVQTAAEALAGAEAGAALHIAEEKDQDGEQNSAKGSTDLRSELHEYQRARSERLKNCKDPLEMFKEMQHSIARASMVIASAFEEGRKPKAEGRQDCAPKELKAAVTDTKARVVNALRESKGVVKLLATPTAELKSAIGFRRARKRLEGDSGSLFALLGGLPPGRLKQIFEPEGSLDTTGLRDIIGAVAHALRVSRDAEASVRESVVKRGLRVLKELRSAARIDLLLMMVEGEQCLKDLIGELSAVGGHAAQDLRASFGGDEA